MKLASIVVLAATLAACGGQPSTKTAEPTITLPAGTSTLKIEIAGIRSAKGTVYAALFNAGEGFPGASPIIGGSREAPANGGSLTFDYPALPAGTYAVSMQHDENDNGELDVSFVGAPIEGYGVTNNITHATSGPTFEESKFELGADQVLSHRINVKY